MKKLTIFLLLFWGLTTATTCKKDTKQPGVVRPADLRVWNTTPYTIYDCTVNPGVYADKNYGQVDINAFSAYKTFDTVYHYGYIKLTMNNRPYQLVPIDYMGETPFSGGKFTYKVSYDVVNDRLILNCIQD